MQISDIDNGIMLTTGNNSLLRKYALKHLGVRILMCVTYPQMVQKASHLMPT